MRWTFIWYHPLRLVVVGPAKERILHNVQHAVVQRGLFAQVRSQDLEKFRFEPAAGRFPRLPGQEHLLRETTS